MEALDFRPRIQVVVMYDIPATAVSAQKSQKPAAKPDDQLPERRRTTPSSSAAVYVPARRSHQSGTRALETPIQATVS